VGGVGIPAIEVLFRPQVCLGQRGPAKWEAWFRADDHDRAAETVLTQGRGGGAPGLATTDDHHRLSARTLSHVLPPAAASRRRFRRPVPRSAPPDQAPWPG